MVLYSFSLQRSSLTPFLTGFWPGADSEPENGGVSQSQCKEFGHAEPWSFPDSDPSIFPWTSAYCGYGTLQSSIVDNTQLAELHLANTTDTGDSVLCPEATDLSPQAPAEFHNTNGLVPAPSGVVSGKYTALGFEDSGQSQSTSVVEFLNDVLWKAHSLDRSQICTDDQLNQDALIRGIVAGWDAVECFPYFCPLWDTLRQIDKRLFRLSGAMTRLCMLRMIHFMLLVRGI